MILKMFSKLLSCIVAITIFFNSFFGYAVNKLAVTSPSSKTECFSDQSKNLSFPIQENEESDEEFNNSSDDEGAENHKEFDLSVLYSKFYEYSASIFTSKLVLRDTERKGLFFPLPLFIQFQNFRI